MKYDLYFNINPHSHLYVGRYASLGEAIANFREKYDYIQSIYPVFLEIYPVIYENAE